jgi:membrane protein involved in colicin uptake
MAETKTRTRASSSKASTKTKAQAKEKSDAAKRKEAEAKAKAQKREAAEKERAAERQKAIDSGALVVNGEVEYHLVEGKDLGKLETRANDVLKALKNSDTPLRKSDIAGADITATGMFAMLKALGLVKTYRSRSGERGGSGVAYLWDGE